jgi:Putative prokaryotic signal transducing protein
MSQVNIFFLREVARNPALAYSVGMDWVEIFRTTDPLEAERLRDEILKPNGVKAVIRDRTSHPFNTPSMAGGYYLAVEAADADRARELLEGEVATKTE